MPRSPVQTLVARAWSFWLVLKTERASPREIGWALFIGGTVGCSPAPFVRTWIGVGIATLVKKSRLWAFVGSHITGNWLVGAWIVLAEIQLSHRIRQGTWLPLTADDVAARGFELLLDWAIGFLLLGVVVGAALGLIGWAVAARAARRAPPPRPRDLPDGPETPETPEELALSQRRRARPPRPSSGSPL